MKKTFLYEDETINELSHLVLVDYVAEYTSRRRFSRVLQLCCEFCKGEAGAVTSTLFSLAIGFLSTFE